MTSEVRSSQPSVLIISLSDISMDGRVLRQVRLLSQKYRVVTCGFGPQPLQGVEHLELFHDTSRLRSYATDACIRLRLYRAAYWLSSVPRSARKILKARDFDAVLANDLNTVMLALSIADGNRIHFDLHEFFPGTDDNIPSWVRHRLPYLEWQLRKYARLGRSATAVSRPIAERYAREYGIDAGTVVNAAPYQDVNVQPVGEPLRFVYSGIAQRPRKVEMVMQAVAESSGGATLDLYLTGEGTPYYDELVAYAKEVGPRVRILKPVKQENLVATLRDYDIGIPLLPLVPTNLALALPNKLFDYVQARLGVISGPNPSMADIVNRYQIGAVGEDNEVGTFINIINSLSATEVAVWKQNSATAARELSAEEQNVGWELAISEIVQSREK